MKNARSVWKRRLPCDYRASCLVFVFLKSLDLCGVAVVVYKYLPRIVRGNLPSWKWLQVFSVPPKNLSAYENLEARIGCMLLFLTCLWTSFCEADCKQNRVSFLCANNFCGEYCFIYYWRRKKWFFLNPYAIPARVVCPFFKIRPNGLPIEDGSPLLVVEHIFPALAISLVLAAAAFWICSKLLGSGRKSNG